MTKMEEYKGYTIEVSPTGLFQAYKTLGLDEGGASQQVAESKTLDELHKTLDILSRAAFANSKVYVLTEEGFVEGKLTAAVKDSYGLQFRVSYKQHRNWGEHEEYTSWSKFQPGQIIKDTPRNKALVEEHNRLKREIENAEKTQHSLVEKMQGYTKEELIGK